MDREELKQLFEKAFPDAEVVVHTEDGVHFAARLVSQAFAGRSRVARHQLVYQALGERMGGEVHALSLQTLTPDEAGA